jgi:uroporphyrinogen-III synthase
MSSGLTGRTIALAEGRQLEELVGMLEKEGANCFRCPMVSILDAPDSTPIVRWLDTFIDKPFDWLILLTGEGLRRLLGVSERANRREAFIEALKKTKILTRGPKPVQALKEINLTPTMIAPAPTTEGVISALRREKLWGRRIGVQLYSPENPPLMKFLEESGAECDPILPYIYAPASDADRVVELIDKLNEGTIDVLVFTSSPQIDRLYEVATERELLNRLKEGLSNTKIASVGPIVSKTLTSLGLPIDICPEQGFVMKNLVQQIKRAFL